MPWVHSLPGSGGADNGPCALGAFSSGGADTRGVGEGGATVYRLVQNETTGLHISINCFCLVISEIEEASIKVTSRLCFGYTVALER